MPALAFHDRWRWIPRTTEVVEGLTRLGGLGPRILAPMHGAAYSGDGTGALEAYAESFRRELERTGGSS